MNKTTTGKLLALEASYGARLGDASIQSAVIFRGDMRAVVTAVAELRKHGLLGKEVIHMSDQEATSAPAPEGGTAPETPASEPTPVTEKTEEATQ